MFGPDEIWQELRRRAEACNVEALVLTVNVQIFGDREQMLCTLSAAAARPGRKILIANAHRYRGCYVRFLRERTSMAKAAKGHIWSARALKEFTD